MSFSQIGPFEIIMILLAALLLFGPKKLPELGRSIGRGIREFKEAFSDVGKSLTVEEEDEKKQ
ncbi:MAG: twin-arginine translocase TatA/TatE family subunit [Firmicutes bacterium]|nr:twin-arginine translocase TatA/TatE family subunit [Bacillota bacterium]